MCERVCVCVCFENIFDRNPLQKNMKINLQRLEAFFLGCVVLACCMICSAAGGLDGRANVRYCRRQQQVTCVCEIFIFICGMCACSHANRMTAGVGAENRMFSYATTRMLGFFFCVYLWIFIFFFGWTSHVLFSRCPYSAQ